MMKKTATCPRHINSKIDTQKKKEQRKKKKEEGEVTSVKLKNLVFCSATLA